MFGNMCRRLGYSAGKPHRAPRPAEADGSMLVRKRGLPQPSAAKRGLDWRQPVQAERLRRFSDTRRTLGIRPEGTPAIDDGDAFLLRLNDEPLKDTVAGERH